MKRLVVETFGEVVQGVTLRGEPSRPEPESFAIRFPGGCVTVTRASDGPGPDYWIHLTIDDALAVREERADVEGHAADARLDIRGKHAGDSDVGDFAHPDLYHVAVRVTAGRAA